MDSANGKGMSHHEVETDGRQQQENAEDIKNMEKKGDLDVGAQVIHGQETEFTKEGM